MGERARGLSRFPPLSFRLFASAVGLRGLYKEGEASIARGLSSERDMPLMNFAHNK